MEAQLQTQDDPRKNERMIEDIDCAYLGEIFHGRSDSYQARGEIEFCQKRHFSFKNESSIKPKRCYLLQIPFHNKMERIMAMSAPKCL